jgi:TRAP-type C4-dicarboxylate transport system permease small subunit
MLLYLKTFARGLDRLVAFIVVALLVVMTAITSAGVFWRYIMNDALSWAEELGCYMLVWVSFLGAALATYRGTHIAIDVVYDRLPRWAQRILDILVNGTIVVFMGAILLSSLKILPVVHTRISPTLFISMDIPYLVLPVSAGIIIFQTLVRMLPEPGEGKP